MSDVKDPLNKLNVALGRQLQAANKLAGLCRQLGNNPASKARKDAMSDYINRSNGELRNMQDMLDTLEPDVMSMGDTAMEDVFLDLRDSYDRLKTSVEHLQAQFEAGHHELH